MVIEYASLKGTFDGMDPTVITEIADYYKNVLKYDIPPMTPFVGSNFNVTRAGVHADGLMRDVEIYNIFDTEKILAKPAEVSISNTSGLAGIAYWMNSAYSLKGDAMLTKQDAIISAMKVEIDKAYEDGRTTIMSDEELEKIAERVSLGVFKKRGHD
jgi:isopropylmalate/homocitrate/citramalate synthase